VVLQADGRSVLLHRDDHIGRCGRDRPDAQDQRDALRRTTALLAEDGASLPF
jgi:hypothetical protein